jgi:enoyl-CoA hydratase
MNIQCAMRKPTIVALNGPARGAGMTLAITSDVILAADDVDVGYPEIDVSVLPAIHYQQLVPTDDLGNPVPGAEAISDR